MKKSLRCPKCDGRHIWRVRPLQTTYEYSPGSTPLRLNYKQATGASGMFATKEAAVGTLSAFICAACGFTELWAGGLEHLKSDPAQGVELLEGT